MKNKQPQTVANERTNARTHEERTTHMLYKDPRELKLGDYHSLCRDLQRTLYALNGLQIAATLIDVHLFQDTCRDAQKLLQEKVKFLQAYKQKFEHDLGAGLKRDLAAGTAEATPSVTEQGPKHEVSLLKDGKNVSR